MIHVCQKFAFFLLKLNVQNFQSTFFCMSASVSLCLSHCTITLTHAIEYHVLIQGQWEIAATNWVFWCRKNVLIFHTFTLFDRIFFVCNVYLCYSFLLKLDGEFFAVFFQFVSCYYGFQVVFVVVQLTNFQLIKVYTGENYCFDQFFSVLCLKSLKTRIYIKKLIFCFPFFIPGEL